MARREGRAIEEPVAQVSKSTRPGAPAFWDASALVPLCVLQDTTARATALYHTNEIVIWWATPVEIQGALARLVRMGQLSADSWRKARKVSEFLSFSWSEIQPSSGLRARAMDVVERYDLRAADALQLAAALEWCEGVAQGRTFLTADERLRDAALLAGFDARAI